MSISVEQLQDILQQQQLQFESAQKNLVESLTRNLNLQSAAAPVPDYSTDAIAASISEFHYEPECGLTFDHWFKRWEDTFEGEFSRQDDAWKSRLLLRKLGTQEHERFVNIILPNKPKDLSFSKTVAQLSEIFGEQTSLFNIRYQCLKLCKKPTDNYIAYASSVNRACERFKYKSLTEDQFKCLIFVAGLQAPEDAEVRVRLLNKIEQEKDVTLKTLTVECQRMLNLKHDTALVEQSSHLADTTSVNAVRKQHQTNPAKQPPSECWLCGEWHFSRFCPFKKHKCQNCDKVGHKEGFCRPPKLARDTQHFQPNRRRPRPSTSRHHSVSNSVVATFVGDHRARRKFITINLNGRPARLQLDTASDITIIARDTWAQVGKPSICPTSHQAINASGQPLKLTGEITCPVSFQDTQFEGTCYITDRPRLNLLGLDWIEKLCLLEVPLNDVCCFNATKNGTNTAMNASEKLQTLFPAVFQEGLGKCTKMQAELVLKPGSKPAFRPKRPVPYAALPTVDQELDRLQQLGIIKPTNYSAWAAPIVVVKKANGKIRICADFSTGLNAALDTHQYPLPIPEDLYTRLNGGAFFAKLDLADAYLQLEVTEASRELLTINTHRGLFQFTRLPFGIKTAPAIFQQVMDVMLTGIQGVAAYLDDIIVVGATQSELQNRLEEVLRRIDEYGFHLRLEKCQFCMPSIKYLGFIIDSTGRRPDPENIEAIQKLSTPTDLPTLRSFLGMISHYSAFLPELHRLRDPFNRLLRKDTPWEWSTECSRTFRKIKQLLTSDLLLTHFDPKLEIVVTTDASNYGIGAVMAHRFPDGSEKAVVHAARSLTQTECNYSQIEKEALGIIYAIKRFHKMLYGRRFTLVTDHKPLLAVFGAKKGIPVYSANRLQRWATMLLGYDFGIEYQSTDKIGQADALSRLMDKHRTSPEDSVVAAVNMESDACCVLNDDIRALPVTAAMVRGETGKDPLLQKVVTLHQTHWPRKCTDPALLPFFIRRESLSIVNGCILFGDRVIVPQIFQRRILRQFHAGHPGINRMKALARSYVYWPHMDSEIEDLVKTCISCQQAAKAPRKTELASWPTPEGPWNRIHIDFAGPVNGVHFLIVVDAYSKWPEIFVMDRPTSRMTVLRLQELFARYGMPETLITDNGRQFTSAEFSAFCEQNGVQHITSPPYHPQSNGQAERFVDTFKRALKKLDGEGTTQEVIAKFLLNYRVTPNPSLMNNNSPAEALMNRKLRLPIDVIRPRSFSRRNVKMERWFNKHHGAKPRSFEAGDVILARDYREGIEGWKTATVIRRHGSVIYEVQVQSQRWIRHANQLKASILPTVTESNDILPMDILLDTFQLPKPTAEQQTIAADTTRRWTDRKRRPVDRLQVDPQRQSYGSSIRRGRC